MIEPDDVPKTLQQAVLYFADLDRCRKFMRAVKWPDGRITCPACKGDDIGEIATRHLLRCRACDKQFSHTVGTVFEASKISLDKWFVGLWALVNCKNGISSYELGRAVGVPQKTAWFMIQRLRAALEIGGFDADKFDGPAEADATYIGGKAKNMHAKRRKKVIQGRGATGKAIVHGVLQRGTDDQPSQVRCEVMGVDDGERLNRAVRRQVRHGADVYTDSASAYGDLALTHIHKSVDHSIAYVNENVHTNGLENFWSLFKRCLKGTYIAVAPFHLFRYVAEEAWRFNERKANDAIRFWRALQGVVGKRLTYRVLTAQDDAGFMGLT